MNERYPTNQTTQRRRARKQTVITYKKRRSLEASSDIKEIDNTPMTVPIKPYCY